MMGKLIKNYGEISLWQLGKDEIPDMTFFVLDNYYMQYWKQHIDVSGEELRNAIAEDLTHFDHGTFFAIKDLDGRLLASIKAIKILKDDKFPLENDFQITYSDLERRVVPLVGDVWLFGRLVVDRDYFNSKPEFVRFRNIIFRILICKAIECMSYSPDNILVADVDVAVCRKLRKFDIDMIPIGSSKIIYASEAVPVYNRMSGLSTFYSKNIHFIR